jgi:uncharacterized phiE125 gp8 family phage protein
MTAVLISPPAVEPVTLTEAKAHLRLAGSDEDDLVAALIVAARVHVETVTRRVLIAQEWRVFLDAAPPDGVVMLPVMPVSAVSAVTVYDRQGLPAVLAPADYTVDLASVPGRLALTGGGPAPGRAFNGIEIDLTAGYGLSGLDVPQPLRLAVMMLAARWHQARDGAFVGTVPQDIADAFAALTAPYRVMRLTS